MRAEQIVRNSKSTEKEPDVDTLRQLVQRKNYRVYVKRKLNMQPNNLAKTFCVNTH